MPPKAKSIRRKKKKLKFVQKQKQPWRVTRNWLELPSDLTVNILQRIGMVDILLNAQFVCTAWRNFCKDPSMWRVVYMDSFPHVYDALDYEDDSLDYNEMCNQVLDRSQGQLLDLTVAGYCNAELVNYIADRSRKLRRLEIIVYYGSMCGFWTEILKKLPLLEELGFEGTHVGPDDIEAAGRYCPLLKTLKVNLKPSSLSDEDNRVVLTIGKNLPQLTHLELIKDPMNNIGLQAILDGCCHLESLDLRGCVYLDLNGDLGKRCSQQIKNLKLPNHPR